MFVNQIYEGIYKDRYEKNNESLEGTLHRVANFVSKAETTDEEQQAYAKKFYQMMKDGLFFPGGRTMSNAGIGKHLTLNNCFVAPIIDNSMEDIFEKVKLGAVTHKAGGGIGYCFSNLSPNGMETHNDAVASGPVSFMDVFNAQTRTVQQGSRRGANMGTLSIYHPDILEFINAKSIDPTRLNHFNLSVVVDDKFMSAVVNDGEIQLHWPIYDTQGNHVVQENWNPKFTKNIKAREIWDAVMQMAYNNGEPGVLFEDTMRRNNPAYYIENIVGTNPCGEYLAGTINRKGCNPADFGGACNLGSVFLHNFVLEPFTEKARIDWNRLENTIIYAVRFLDDIIDINKFPNKIYENYQKNMRTIGLGYTGLADALVMLGFQYNTQKARDFVERLMRFCAEVAYMASIDLAIERGAFPFCDNNLHAQSEYVQRLGLNKEYVDKLLKYGIRNAKIQAVAPTGTLSLTFGNNCSSGIEPIFSLSYKRKAHIGGQEENNVQEIELMDYAFWKYNQMLTNGEKIDFDPSNYFVTAMNMDVDAHVDMLAIIQKYVDMSVSKTINVPTDYSFEDTKNIYMKAWKLGIKGCTIFRPNEIRKGILINEDSVDENNETDSSVIVLPRGTIIECSSDLVGKKRKLTTGCGSLHVLAYFNPINGELQEVYLAKGSTGGCANFMTGLSRAISLLCRAGVSVYDIKDQLDSSGTCPSYATRTATKRDTSKGSSCPIAIGNALIEMYNEMQDDLYWNEENVEEETNLIPVNFPKQEENHAPSCPECGEDLIREGGCIQCKSCGWSKCS